jgi:hypothetical protein
MLKFCCADQKTTATKNSQEITKSKKQYQRKPLLQKVSFFVFPAPMLSLHFFRTIPHPTWPFLGYHYCRQKEITFWARNLKNTI